MQDYCVFQLRVNITVLGFILDRPRFYIIATATEQDGTRLSLLQYKYLKTHKGLKQSKQR
jgi:hypothetical protein